VCIFSLNNGGNGHGITPIIIVVGELEKNCLAVSSMVENGTKYRRYRMPNPGLILELSKLAPEDEEKADTNGKGRSKKTLQRSSQGSELGKLDLEKYLSHFGVAYTAKRRLQENDPPTQLYLYEKSGGHRIFMNHRHT